MSRNAFALSCALGLLVSLGTALAAGPHGKNDTAAEEPALFWGAGAEVDGAELNWFEDGSGALVNWDGYAWIGGDEVKLRLEAEGAAFDGDVESAELRALISWNIADFWDFQAGLRHDFEPEGMTWVAAGFQGLAPYFFEIEARVFVSEDADVAFRFEQTYDLLITQRLILQPHVKVNAFAQDIPELAVGAGFADVEAGLQLRYEITRKFAPYIDLVYERALGETAGLMRAAGEDVEETTLRGGVRFWF
jgi:copper resistance protein B